MLYSYWLISNRDGLNVGDIVLLTLILLRVYNSFRSLPKHFSSATKSYSDSDFILDLVTNHEKLKIKANNSSGSSSASLIQQQNDFVRLNESGIQFENVSVNLKPG